MRTTCNLGVKFHKTGELLLFLIFQDQPTFSRANLQNSRTILGQMAQFFKFQDVFRTKVKFKDFSRSVRTLQKKLIGGLPEKLSSHCDVEDKMGLNMTKPVFGASIRSYQNQSAQLQRLARIVKFGSEQVLI